MHTSGTSTDRRRGQTSEALSPDAVPVVPYQETALAAVAQTQAGLFTYGQAIHAGFTRAEIRHRLRSRVWTRLDEHVYLAATSPITTAVRAANALLRCGDEAVFSHITAARLHGLEVRTRDSRPWVSVPAHRRAPELADGVVFRTRHPPQRAARLNGWPATEPARTLVDLAGQLPRPLLRSTLHGALRAKAVDLDAVARAAEEIGGGRRGLAVVHEAIAQYDAAAESGAEARAQSLLVRAGVKLRPQVEVWDGPFLIARLDLGDEEVRFGVEVDGPSHWLESRPQRDRRRDRRLLRRDWEVLRYTTDDVYDRPRTFVSEVRHAYAVRRRRFGLE